MIAAPLPDRFSLLTADLKPTQWRWLGALALEQGLTRGVLLALSPDAGSERALDAFSKRALELGLLIAVGPTRAISLTAAPSRERGFALPVELRQLVLRALASRGELRQLARATAELLGGRSVSDLSCALAEGDYAGFSRRFSVERLPRQVPLRSAAEWLHQAICEPFDAEWLVAAYGEQARNIGQRVVSEALESARPVAALSAWLAAGLGREEEPDARELLASLLCEHALLRGAPDEALHYLGHLSEARGLGYAAAAAFVQGDLVLARTRLDPLVRGALGRGASARRRALPHCGAVQPLLALLVSAAGDEPALALSRKLLALGQSPAARGAARALRALQRHLEQPESEHERLDVHDLGSGAGVWETLIAAHDAQLHQRKPETRARWAQYLIRSALEWQAAGYAFLAAQAGLLARELSSEYAAQELSRLAPGAASELAAPRLSAWDLVVPRPEWQKSLEALALVSAEVEAAAETGLRVAWYLDMSDGSLNRPALQEHRIEGGGWSQGRRLSLGELYGFRERLPPEDQQVLDATREVAPGRREALPEAHERLIGHPRVLNGARGGMRVEVVRGSCRVVSVEEPGYVRLAIEPAFARPGLNLVPEHPGRLLVYRVNEAMQRVLEVVARGVRVPSAERAQLLSVLGRLSQGVEVDSPELGPEREVEPDLTPCLRFAPHAGAWLVQAGVRPFGAQGRFFVAGTGRPSVSMILAGERLRCERNFERERVRVDALIAACPSLATAVEETEGRPRHELDNWVLGEEAVLGLLSELRASGLAHELEWPENNRLRLRGDARSALQGRLRVDKGWYLATGGLRLDEVTEVSLAQLVSLPALAGGRFVRLESGDYVELEARIRRVVAALAAGGARTRQGRELRLHPAALLSLGELSERDGLELDAPAADWLARARRLAGEMPELPAGLRADLRPYQIEGYRWLYRLSELGLGACLADDMGLGKTVQILALLLARREQGPALVVAPTSVCENWALEARRFAPELEVLSYCGEGRGELLKRVQREGVGKLLVCSYQLMQQDQSKLCELEWGTAVLDEAQFIKNSQSLRARAAFRLNARQRVAATGTPVENHAADLWSIFHFLNPGLLGEFGDFNRRFLKPIDREGAHTPEQLLRRVVQPYVLRRLKRDVLRELPPLTELQHDVELSPDEALRYAVLRRQVHDKLFTPHGKRENKLEVLAEIMRLRRFCCHPRLVFPDADLESSKLQAFVELVEELRENGHRALVFSQFVDFLALVRDVLDERHIAYEYLDGSTPQAERQARVDAFQQGSASLFLISLKAGGFGLNLTAADYVIHLDPWWNPAVETQATDRAHRIGQTRRVTVYRLVTRHSIEEKIVELHARKRSLAASLLAGTEAAAAVGVDELLGLLAAERWDAAQV